MLDKKVYKITRVKKDDKANLGKYLLKAGAEAPMDFFRNILHRDTTEEVAIKRIDNGFIMTESSEPDTSYALELIPMDDSFWNSCTIAKIGA